jgi:protein involved in polysaccharide export with SLBB domain
MTKRCGGAVVALGLIAMVAGMLSGCASSSSSGPTTFTTPVERVQQADYVIQPGDSIDIKFYFHPENNQDNVLVRPDGKILLALIGEVQAAGLTTPELSDAIMRGYSKNLRDPKVAVNVRTLNQTRIFVGGEVTRPGFVSYVPGMTAVQAVVQAGGWKDTADLEQVVLLQKMKEGSNEYRPTKLNLAKVVEQGETSADVALGPSDVVVIPKTGIAKANTWMEQYVIKMLPIRISATPF